MGMIAPPAPDELAPAAEVVTEIDRLSQQQDVLTVVVAFIVVWCGSLAVASWHSHPALRPWVVVGCLLGIAAIEIIDRKCRRIDARVFELQQQLG